MLGSRFAHTTAVRVMAVVLIVAACSPNQPSIPPVTGPAPSSLATSAASRACNLDAAQSDAGVVGCVTLANDTDGNRDGRYDIIGRATATLEGGPFGIKVWEAQWMDFSFVGITDYMPLIGTR